MNLSEAFKQLDCLNEDVFEVSDKGIEELKDFRDSDDSDDTIEVIDPEAENKEEIKDMDVYVREDLNNETLNDEDIFRINEKIKDLEKQIVNVIEG